MWSQTRSSALRGLYAAFVVVAVLMVSLTLSGCAKYSFSQGGPSILGDGTKTLKIKEVDNPTMYPWLPFHLRSQLRDEIGARKLAVWVDEGRADYELRVKVKSFSLRSWARSSTDTSLIYTATLNAELIVYNGATNTQAWTSGPQTYSDQYETLEEATAVRETTRLLTRKLVDKMRHNF